MLNEYSFIFKKTENFVKKNLSGNAVIIFTNAKPLCRLEKRTNLIYISIGGNP